MKKYSLIGLIFFLLLIQGCDPSFRMYQATMHSDMALKKRPQFVIARHSMQGEAYNRISLFEDDLYDPLVIATLDYKKIERLRKTDLMVEQFEDTLFVTSKGGTRWEIPYHKNYLLFGYFVCSVDVNLDTLIADQSYKLETGTVGKPQ